MKLYYSPGACSLAPHIVMREAGVSFTLEQVDLPSRRTAGGMDFSSVNARGQVPVLELDNGLRLTEGAIIAQHVSELVRNSQLLPPAGLARYRVLEWQNYVSTELHKSFWPLFNGDFDDPTRDQFRRLLRNKFSWVDSHLEGRAYLTGDNFTVADAYLFTVTRWCGPAGVDLRGLEMLHEYQRNVSIRPAVRAALEAESGARAAA